MIRSRRSRLAEFLFSTYLKQIFKHSFSAFKIVGKLPEIPLDSQIILTPNHMSWWDGFFPFLLNRTLWKRDFHLMMLEKELTRFWFFRWLGVFSIDPRSASSVRESFRYVDELLNGSRKIALTIFPEGELRPDVAPHLHLKEGLRLLKAENPTIIVPLCFRIEPGDERRPTLYVMFGELLALDEYRSDPKVLETRLNKVRNNLHQEMLIMQTSKGNLGNNYLKELIF